MSVVSDSVFVESASVEFVSVVFVFVASECVVFVSVGFVFVAFGLDGEEDEEDAVGSQWMKLSDTEL